MNENSKQIFVKVKKEITNIFSVKTTKNAIFYAKDGACWLDSLEEMDKLKVKDLDFNLVEKFIIENVFNESFKVVKFEKLANTLSQSLFDWFKANNIYQKSSQNVEITGIILSVSTLGNHQILRIHRVDAFPSAEFLDSWVEYRDHEREGGLELEFEPTYEKVSNINDDFADLNFPARFLST